MLVRHPLDRECAETTIRYQRLLTEGDATFADTPLDSLVDVVAGSVRDECRRHWVAGLRTRYLDLSASEDAWQNR